MLEEAHYDLIKGCEITYKNKTYKCRFRRCDDEDLKYNKDLFILNIFWRQMELIKWEHKKLRFYQIKKKRESLAYLDHTVQLLIESIKNVDAHSIKREDNE